VHRPPRRPTSPRALRSSRSCRRRCSPACRRRRRRTTRSVTRRMPSPAGPRC